MKNILLIGETCTDEFIYGSVDRISQESPCPIFLSNGDKETTEGMCANVKNNIDHLSDDLIVDIITNASPIIKRRLIDTRHNVMVYRVDESDTTRRIDISLISNTDKYDAVVVSDYNKGFLLDEDLSSIGSLFQCPKFIDTKKILNSSWSRKFNFIKVNYEEYKNSLILHKDKERLKQMCHNLIVTQGKNGALLLSAGQESKFEGINISCKHVSGAGDSFLSGLVVSYLESKNIKQSIDFANSCAALAVSKENISIVSKEEVDNFRKSHCD